MLRDYKYTENWRLLDFAMEMFISLPPRLSLVGFTELSPDSFVWKIFDGQTMYYLYAEDYVPSLEHIKEQVAFFAPRGTTFEFLKAKKQIAFEDSIPNRFADVYRPPADEYEFSEYATQSGFDFVFLLQSSEAPEDYA